MPFGSRPIAPVGLIHLTLPILVIAHARRIAGRHRGGRRGIVVGPRGFLGGGSGGDVLTSSGVDRDGAVGRRGRDRLGVGRGGGGRSRGWRDRRGGGRRYRGAAVGPPALASVGPGRAGATAACRAARGERSPPARSTARRRSAPSGARARGDRPLRTGGGFIMGTVAPGWGGGRSDCRTSSASSSEHQPRLPTIARPQRTHGRPRSRRHRRRLRVSVGTLSLVLRSASQRQAARSARPDGRPAA